MSICDELADFDEDEIWLFQPDVLSSKAGSELCTISSQSSVTEQSNAILDKSKEPNLPCEDYNEDSHQPTGFVNLPRHHSHYNDANRSFSKCSFTNSSINLLEDKDVCSKRSRFLEQMLFSNPLIENEAKTCKYASLSSESLIVKPLSNPQPSETKEMCHEVFKKDQLDLSDLESSGLILSHSNQTSANSESECNIPIHSSPERQLKREASLPRFSDSSHTKGNCKGPGKSSIDTNSVPSQLFAMNKADSKSMLDLRESKNSKQFKSIQRNTSKSSENVSRIPVRKATKFADPQNWTSSRRVQTSLTSKMGTSTKSVTNPSNLTKHKSLSMNNLTNIKKKDHSHVESKVKKYIENMKAKEATNKFTSLPSTPVRKKLNKSNSYIYDDESLRSLSLMNIAVEDIPEDLKTLKEEMAQQVKSTDALDKIFDQLLTERRSCLEQYELRNALEMEYNKLLLKYAQAQDVIHFLRFKKEDTLDDNQGSPLRPGRFFTSSPKRSLSKSFSALNLSLSSKGGISPVASHHTKCSSSLVDQSITNFSNSSSPQNEPKRPDTSFAKSVETFWLPYSDWIAKYQDLDKKMKEYALLQSMAALTPDEGRTILQYILNKFHELVSSKLKNCTGIEEADANRKLKDLSLSLDCLSTKCENVEADESHPTSGTNISTLSEPNIKPIEQSSKLSSQHREERRGDTSNWGSGLSSGPFLDARKSEVSIPKDTVESSIPSAMTPDFDYLTAFQPSKSDLEDTNEDTRERTSFDASKICFARENSTDIQRSDPDYLGRKDKKMYEITSFPKLPDNDSGCPPSDRSIKLVHPQSAEQIGGIKEGSISQESCSFSNNLAADVDVENYSRHPSSRRKPASPKVCKRSGSYRADGPPLTYTELLLSASSSAEEESGCKAWKEPRNPTTKIRISRNGKPPMVPHKAANYPALPVEKYPSQFTNPNISEFSDSSISSDKAFKKRHYISSLEKDREVYAGKMESIRKDGFQKNSKRRHQGGSPHCSTPLKAGLNVVATNLPSSQPLKLMKPKDLFTKTKDLPWTEATDESFHCTSLPQDSAKREKRRHRRHRSLGGNSDSGLVLHTPLSERDDGQSAAPQANLKATSKMESRSLNNFRESFGASKRSPAESYPVSYPLIYIEHYNCCQEMNKSANTLRHATSRSHEDVLNLCHSYEKPKAKIPPELSDSLDEAATLAHETKVSSTTLLNSLRPVRKLQTKRSSLSSR